MPYSTVDTLIHATQRYGTGSFTSNALERAAKFSAPEGWKDFVNTTVDIPIVNFLAVFAVVLLGIQEVYHHFFNKPEIIREHTQIGCGVLLGIVTTSPSADRRILNVKLSSDDTVTYEEREGKLFSKINDGQEAEYRSIQSIEALKAFYLNDIDKNKDLYDKTVEDNPDLKRLVEKAKLYLKLSEPQGYTLDRDLFREINDLYELTDENIDAAYAYLYPEGTEHIDALKLLKVALMGLKWVDLEQMKQDKDAVDFWVASTSLI